MGKRQVYRGGLTFPLSFQPSGGWGGGGPRRSCQRRVRPVVLTLPFQSQCPLPALSRRPPERPPTSSAAAAPPSAGFLPLPFPWGADSPSCHVSLMTSTQSARP